MSTLAKRIRLFRGDITSLDCEAIVTAANGSLCGGGGVDGAVHAAAGPELVRASMALGPCPTGEARITDGFKLSAKYVIHAVGPVFNDLVTSGPELASAYEFALQLALEHKIQSIAFPCISTGVYGFPSAPACEIAVETVLNWLGSHEIPQSVTFCCFEYEDKKLYENRMNELGVVD
ncbi:MAG: macro domain-containing protein [Planctomycetota bacterium]